MSRWSRPAAEDLRNLLEYIAEEDAEQPKMWHRLSMPLPVCSIAFRFLESLDAFLGQENFRLAKHRSSSSTGRGASE
jgi:hypothetical protein